MSNEKQLTEVEHIKARSRHLRGTIEEGLKDRVTGALSPDDTQLTKFHGFYQQDDRDLRAERKQQRLEPLYSFMLRARVPGGVITSKQWQAIDQISRELTSGSLRLTTRQTFQYHGIAKHNIKPVIQGINQVLIDSIAACGDVNRNVLANTNPVDSRLHNDVYWYGTKLSEHFLPKTRAYHEIWLDEEKVASYSEEKEPIYGDTYLPRKFKMAIAVPPHNDVDVYANDLGLIAIANDGELEGFNVLVGGGMGSTHNEPETYPQLGRTLGFINAKETIKVAEAIVTTQRDFGCRTNRKHARLKYTVDDMGVEAFRKEVERRSGIKFAPARAFEFTMHSDRFGWTETDQGKWNLTLFIENGRISDKPEAMMMTGLIKIADLHQGDFRMTATQNLVIANIAPEKKGAIEKLAKEHGLLRDGISALRQNSMACVALPTCSLAMAEAERYLPNLISKIETLVDKNGLSEQPIVIRMTGCPNGCARPFLAEIAMIGKAPGKYNLYLGGDGKGSRLNKLYRENIDEEAILAELEPLFETYAKKRHKGEGFGDFVVRTDIVPAVTDGTHFND